MRVKNENLLDDSGEVLMDANVTLKPVWLGHIANFSIQLVFTGTPNGSFKLQVSNDAGSIGAAGSPEQYAGVVNWTDVPASVQAITAAGDHTWQVSDCGYNWVRVVYLRNSGTGTLTSARAYMKGV